MIGKTEDVKISSLRNFSILRFTCYVLIWLLTFSNVIDQFAYCLRLTVYVFLCAMGLTVNGLV